MVVRRWYWWLVAKDEKGQRYLIFGSEKGEDDARQKGFEMGLVDFEIKRFPTRDVGAASHMLKYGIAKQERDIRQGGKRLRHKIPQRRSF